MPFIQSGLCVELWLTFWPLAMYSHTYMCIQYDTVYFLAIMMMIMVLVLVYWCIGALLNADTALALTMTWAVKPYKF